MNRCDVSRGQGGFTLIEVLVVVAILGFTLGLVVTRGPARSASLEMQSAVGQLVQTMRVARSMAIAANGPVWFILDPAARSMRIANRPPTILPGSLTIAMTAATLREGERVLSAIRFNGDGSASGGRIDVTDGQRRTQIAVDWLTGRVSTRAVR